MFTIEITETGDILDTVETRAEAEEIILQNEKEDRAEGEYTPGWYAITNTETEEFEIIDNGTPINPEDEDDDEDGGYTLATQSGDIILQAVHHKTIF